MWAKALDLLKRRDTDRKNKALEQVRQLREKTLAEERAILALVGLGTKAAVPKKRRAPGNKGSGKAVGKVAAPNPARKAG